MLICADLPWYAVNLPAWYLLFQADSHTCKLAATCLLTFFYSDCDGVGGRFDLFVWSFLDQFLWLFFVRICVTLL